MLALAKEQRQRGGEQGKRMFASVCVCVCVRVCFSYREDFDDAWQISSRWQIRKTRGKKVSKSLTNFVAFHRFHLQSFIL